MSHLYIHITYPPTTSEHLDFILVDQRRLLNVYYIK